LVFWRFGTNVPSYLDLTVNPVLAGETQSKKKMIASYQAFSSLNEKYCPEEEEQHPVLPPTVVVLLTKQSQWL